MANLANLEDLRSIIAEHFDRLRVPDRSIDVDQIYCPGCLGRRRVRLKVLMLAGRAWARADKRRRDFGVGYGDGTDPEEAIEFLREGMAPALIEMSCLQCDATFTGVVYVGPDGEDLSIFSSVRGGLSTERTPDAVRYYLDQADRARSAGAMSAAISMFRVALEHLLEEQGYKQRMCGPKIAALESDLADGKAPKWAFNLGTEVLVTLKDLGNGTLHTNGGDITLQANATPELVDLIGVALEELLDEAYERPAKASERHAQMSAAAAKFKGSKSPPK